LDHPLRGIERHGLAFLSLLAISVEDGEINHPAVEFLDGHRFDFRECFMETIC
jgi:hypothetical protein